MHLTTLMSVVVFITGVLLLNMSILKISL